ncbi:glycosyltransferase [Pseudovibrio exalbescens]|uniref:glycosyltransferase n=1 Tax=Pseudovibrio exalbescens TaxID=197461 RepID=UPI0011AF402F|nr:glycosyltransferase [Pseudovibrio exalbescens]
MSKHLLLPDYCKANSSWNSDSSVDLSIVNIAYRPEPEGSATGGPNGVLSVQRNLLGTDYRGFSLRYYFEPRKLNIPPLWLEWVKEQKIGTMSKNLLFAHCFIQTNLAARLPKSFLVDPRKVTHFFCHDIGSAAAAHFAGLPYTLMYHQQGAFVHERRSFGEALNETELYLMNYFEQVAFENASSVYFPSLGAKQAFEATTTSVDLKKVNFAEKPLYNTLGEITVNQSKLSGFFDSIGLSELNDPIQRKNILLIVSVGDYTFNKGTDRCPHILNTLAQRADSHIVWLCMGSKHKSGIYEEIYSNKGSYSFKAVTLPERQPHDLTMAAVEAADWLLMLQRHSIFDFSSLEAMKLGTGLALSPVGGNIEFNKKDNVIFVDPSAPEEGVARLARADPKRYGELNRDVYNAFFSSNNFVSSYLEAYDEIISRHLPPKHVNRTNSFSTKFEKLINGKDVVICGAGSSLKLLDTSEYNSHTLIALNSALLHDVPFHIHIMQDNPHDERLWDSYLSKDVVRMYGVINRPATSDLAIDFDYLTRKSVIYETYELAEYVFDERFNRHSPISDSGLIEDLRGVVFSALQLCAKSKARSVKLIGVDFSNENFSGRNTNKYNKSTIENLIYLTKQLEQSGIPVQLIATTSSDVLDAIGDGELVRAPNIQSAIISDAGKQRGEGHSKTKNQWLRRTGELLLPKYLHRPAYEALKKAGLF